jgi:transposase
VSAPEHRVWNTVDEIVKRDAATEWNQARKESATGRVVGVDEVAMKHGPQSFASVRVALEPVEIIDMLDDRDKEKRINYFNQKGIPWGHPVEGFCADRGEGLISTAHAVLPPAVRVVDRFHFFQYMNKAVDNQRKHWRKICTDDDECQPLHGALLNNRSALTDDEKKKRTRAFFLAPELTALYEQKEKLRDLFEPHVTTEQAQQQSDQWIEKAKKLNHKSRNHFLNPFNNWKDYVLNYFTYCFTTSSIEGINNSIKTIKRMGFGFRNFQNFKNRVLLSFIWTQEGGVHKNPWRTK